MLGSHPLDLRRPLANIPAAPLEPDSLPNSGRDTNKTSASLPMFNFVAIPRHTGTCRYRLPTVAIADCV